MPNNGFCEIVNFQSYREIESTHEFEFDEVRIQDNECTK